MEEERQRLLATTKHAHKQMKRMKVRVLWASATKMLLKLAKNESTHEIKSGGFRFLDRSKSTGSDSTTCFLE